MSQANELHRSGEYKRQNVTNLLNALLALTENDQESLVQLFNRIPVEVLHVAPTVETDVFTKILERYVEAVEKTIGGCSFPYAEVVANAMEAVFTSQGSTPEMKTLALRAILAAGVDLNRFSAMETFDSLLTAVKDPETAHRVNEMLKAKIERYAAVVERIPLAQIHPALNDAWNAEKKTQLRLFLNSRLDLRG